MNKLVMNVLNAYFSSEVTNAFDFFNDEIWVTLCDGSYVKIVAEKLN